MSFYIPKYFKIAELVHPDILAEAGEAVCWQMFDDRLLRRADDVRADYGVCIVNTAAMKDRGVRKMNSATGVKYSQHKFFRALDISIAAIDSATMNPDGTINELARIKAYNDVRAKLLADPRFADCSFEVDIGWLHIDTGNRQNREIPIPK